MIRLLFRINGGQEKLQQVLKAVSCSSLQLYWVRAAGKGSTSRTLLRQSAEKQLIRIHHKAYTINGLPIPNAHQHYATDSNFKNWLEGLSIC